MSNQINSKEFLNAAKIVSNLKTKPVDDEMLELYAYFKQAVIGDASDDSKPGFLDFKGKAKWTAWKKVSGTSKHDAECKYIEIVNTLIKKYGLN